MSTNREARYKQLAQEARRRLRQTAEALENTRAENERIMAENAEIHDTLGQHAGQMTRDAFDHLALAHGTDPDKLDDLYKLAAPDPDEDLDAEALQQHVRAALENRREYLAPVDDGDDDEDEDDTPPENVFDIAPRKRGQPNPAEDDDAPARLGKGEGAARGSRHDRREETLAGVVNRDFAATGRDSSTKL